MKLLRSTCLGALVACVVAVLVLSGLVAIALYVWRPCPEPQPISVLLVSPDSLRADRLPAWGALPWTGAADPEPPPTPNLDRLIARGTLYDNAWATSPWTAPSMVSVMTGLYPPAHGVAYRDDTTPPGLPTLPRLLASADYEIGNFSFFSQISYFRNLGLGPTEEGLKDHRQVPGAFAAWLADVPEDVQYFAWVHLLETHLPYGATGYRATEVQMPGSPGLERAQTRGTVPVGSTEFAPGDRRRLLELYDRDVEAMDDALGLLLDALEAEDRLDSTLIVFVADHGEELLDGAEFEGTETPWVGHASTAVEAHLYPQIVRVPLVVAGPGVAAGARRSDLVSQADILPSVLRLLGRQVPEQAALHHLPGVGDRWIDQFLPGRQRVYFDSSPGGNLTPQEQRGVRIQGVGDGVCVVSERSEPGRDVVVDVFAVPGASCDEEKVRALRADLDDWRREQTELRLELLAATEGGPDPKTADGWPQSLRLVEPSVEVLRHGITGGQVALSWSGSDDEADSAPDDGAERGGEASDYWIEYRSLGSRAAGAGFVRGMFQVEQTRVVFGPVPPGFWNDLAIYSPFEIRVLDPAAEARSGWVRFEVERAE